MADLIDREALLKGTCNSCDGWVAVIALCLWMEGGRFK